MVSVKQNPLRKTMITQANDSRTFFDGWGARLTQVRKLLKKTQADIGGILEVRNTAVSKWESEAITIDERSLKTLEFVLGINPDWVRQGQGKMLVSNWNEEMRNCLTGMAGATINGVWVAGNNTGMAPHILPGDVVMWVTPGTLVEGAVYLVAPKGAPFENPSVAPKGSKIGQAFPVEAEDGSQEWLLYRQEDRYHPGTYAPISLRDMQIIGRAIAFGRRLVVPELA
jgi:DNA-binding XRE family transcriptional regulator